MIAALAPEFRVCSTAHVMARGQFPGRGSGRIAWAHGVCLLYASQQPPPLWVVWLGRRASGLVSGGEGALT